MVAASAGVVVLLTGATPAWASHFRAAEFSWSRTEATSHLVTFSMTESFRRNFNGWTYFAATGGGTPAAPNVGDVVQDGNTRVYFGDNTVVNPYLLVTTVDAANNLLTVEALNTNSPTSGHLTHTYPSSTGDYTAQLSGCCRLGGIHDNPPAGHINNPDVSTLVNTLVNLGSGALSSVSSSLPPVVDCPRDSPCNFTIPASVPSGMTASYRLSTGSEASDQVHWASSGVFQQPPGAAVTSAGLFTWNTSGKLLAPSPLDTYYSAQVTITAANQNGVGTSSVAVDFFLRITDQSNNPPAWGGPTPSDGSIIDATPGEPVNVSVQADDPDAGSSVTLGVVNKPADATFTTSGTNPASGTFTWTPSITGDTVLNFTAADQFGLGAVPRSVTIRTTKKSPTIVWPTPTSIVYGTALGADQLDAALSTDPGAAQPPNPGTLTYSPAAGTVLHGGDNTLSVTWTPDPTDAAGWNSVISTVTLHVNPAAQTLTFDPAIDDSVTYTYGDPPFSVTAVSSAGLPVTYGVATADTCTSDPQADGSASIAITGAGTCTVSADQPGDSDYSAAPTISHSFSIAKLTPTLSLAPASITYGTPLGDGQLDALIDPGDAASNGTISYLVDSTPVSAGTIVPGGDHTMTAVFAPDAATGGDYNPVSASADFFVAQASQSISFGALVDKTVGDAAFPVHASADSGLPVSFSTSTSDACSVTPDGTVTVLHAGTCTIAADQSGDNNYLPAQQVSQSFTIDKAPQTITFDAPADHTYLDAPFGLSGTGGPSGAPVTFVAEPTTVCTVDGSNVVINGAGDCTITASQAGNDDYLAAPDVVHTITIHKATPAISWSTPARITYGTPLGAAQLDATTQPSDIAGEFSYTLADGTTPAAGALLHASATPQTLNVTFTPADPDADNFTSATGQTTILVDKADQAISWTDVPAAATYGDPPFTVGATGGGSTNPVTFTAQPGSGCTVSGSTVTITAAGSCVLDADQAGNDDYNAAPTSTRSLTVAKQTPTISWPTPAHITYGTALGAAQLDATVNPSAAAAAGTLAYSTDAASGDAAGQVLHAGNHTLTATYTPASSGDGTNYTSATAAVTLVIDQAPQAITGFATIPDQTYGAGPMTLSATGGGSGNPVYFTVDAGSSCAVSGSTLTLTGAGTCTVIAHQDGSADFNPAPDIAQTFQIRQAPQAITFGALPNAYVGDPATTLTATGGGSGNPVTFAAGPAATCTVTPAGVLTITGPGTCSVTASQAGNTNYLPADPVTRSFAVAYRVCVLSDQTQPHESGSTVPLKVTLCNPSGANAGASSNIVLHATGVDDGPAAAPGNAQPGNNFRYTTAAGGSYQYNLDTTGLPAGTHEFSYTVGGDPTRHTIAVVIG